MSHWNDDQLRRLKIGLSLLVALLLHLGFYHCIPYFFPKDKDAESFVVDSISPSEIAQIKKQWKQKDIVVIKNKKNVVENAPKDSKYASDKNREVKKQTRARVADVIASDGKKGSQKSKNNSKKDLAKLGLPSPLEKKENSDQGDGGSGQFPLSEQALLDSNLPIGAENLLNTERSIYYSFYARVREKVGPVWKRLIYRSMQDARVRPDTYLTAIEVTLNEKGQLLETKKLQSSGILAFDKAANDCWWEVKGFPNPPSGLIRNQKVKMTWSFVFESSNVGVHWSVVPPKPPDL